MSRNDQSLPVSRNDQPGSGASTSPSPSEVLPVKPSPTGRSSDELLAAQLTSEADSPLQLPPLDCHAHIAPDLTPAQVAGLGGALVFAMTRNPAEARAAARRRDDTLLWGLGVHPAVPSALTAVEQASPSRLASMLENFTLIGEVGLDRRGSLSRQTAALETVLNACSGRAVLLSLHSTGRTRELLALLRQQPHPGAILHWFNGTPDEIAEAAALGCYFSINHAMTDQRLTAIPSNRMLPETDFPASRRTILASRPGDVHALEHKIAQSSGVDTAAVRQNWYANLHRLTTDAGVTRHLPAAWRHTLAQVRSP